MTVPGTTADRGGRPTELRVDENVFNIFEERLPPSRSVFDAPVGVTFEKTSVDRGGDRSVVPSANA